MTNVQIKELRTEAREAGDEAQVAICDRALAGDAEAIAECERVVSEAAAQQEHYTDVSPFSGWREFSTPNDGDIRIHVSGRQMQCYRKQGSSFILGVSGTLEPGLKAQFLDCKQLHGIMRQWEFEQDE